VREHAANDTVSLSTLLAVVEAVEEELAAADKKLQEDLDHLEDTVNALASCNGSTDNATLRDTTSLEGGRLRLWVEQFPEVERVQPYARGFFVDALVDTALAATDEDMWGRV